MARPYSRLSSFRRFAAWLALLAMLVPVATGLVHRSEALFSSAHICSSQRQTGDRTPAPHKAPDCPICQHLHLLGNGFVPPDTVALVLIAAALAGFFFSDRSFSLRLRLAPQARPRAPPLFV